MVDKTLNYGREQISFLVDKSIYRLDKARILDIGAGTGTDLANIGRGLNCIIEKYGIEGYGPNVDKLNKQGVDTVSIDIEKEVYPFEDDFFDVVIANQIMEHTKEIFWIVSEVSRILKPGGTFVVGVPNLASFHNRLLLMFGKQPTCIKMFSAHLRGYTYKDFKTYIETDGYFEVLDVKGSNFYPFPACIAKILSKIFPKASVSIFIMIRRTEKEGKFIDVLRTRFLETNYYIGDGKTVFDGFDDSILC